MFTINYNDDYILYITYQFIFSFWLWLDASSPKTRLCVYIANSYHAALLLYD